MIEVIEQKTGAPRIPFFAKNGILFFNCTQETIDNETIDKEVERGTGHTN
jgi:hypothetical protein